MNPKQKLEQIVDLQNEIYALMLDLKKTDIVVTRVGVDRFGRLRLHLQSELTLAEMFPEYDVEYHTDVYERCIVELEGVEIIALRFKEKEEEAE